MKRLLPVLMKPYLLILLSLLSLVLSGQARAVVTPLIASGGYHNIALNADGKLWAWGWNSYGQLGDDTYANASFPKLIGTGYSDVSASSGHSLALKPDGSLWAWGWNNYGQLGDNTTTNSTIPKLIGSGYSAIAAGDYHTLALKPDGSLWAWGRNLEGQLGDGSTLGSSIPKLIDSGYSAIAAGWNYSLALKSNGELWAWGWNSNGQLGNGTYTKSNLPKLVGSGYSAIAAGVSHALALKGNGELWAWGNNGNGQLGDGTTSFGVTLPKLVGTGYSAVAAGWDHSVALKSGGGLWAWGNNGNGQLGDGTTTNSSVPKLIGAGYNAIAAGDYHTLALKSDGSVSAWGQNANGQLGIGTASGPQTCNGFSCSPVPVQVLSASGQTFTLNTAVAPTLVSLTVNFPATLQSSGKLPLTATALFSDQSSKAVTALWKTSNPAVATVSSTGILSAALVTADTQVTLTAIYTENGVTVSASKIVTISATPASLASLALLGPSVIQSGGQVLLRAIATYADGSIRPVIPTNWSVSNALLGFVSSRGVLTLREVTRDTPLTVTATYTQGSLSKSASLTLNISATPATLSNLALLGARGTLAAGETLNLVALGVYSDGSRKAVAATWSLSSATAASISSTGELTANTVSQDTPVRVTATYTLNGVTVTAHFLTVIQATAVPVPLLTEVEATGTWKSYSLKLWFNTNVLARFAGGNSYNAYVAALVPGGQVVTVPTFFLLNRDSEWQVLSWPLAEFLSGVEENSWQLIELIDQLDVSMISGTQIYVGYGTSDQEMLAAGRYQLAYQLP